jgi:eukaryotic-like serine/threonine-protein kinase
MGDPPSDTPTFVADDATAATADGRSSTTPTHATASPLRYRDHDSLGRGGMGEVRRCDDTVIGRDVAFKAMRPGSSPEARLRFLHEARLQARLEHPSIVPVYDMGTDADGNPWFTMRRIDGVTLERVIERLAAGDPEATERWSRRRLLADFVRVCQAVAHAHRQGVVHRDIKPSNVILTDDGGVYLLDWGIAKLQAAGEPATADEPAEGAPPAAATANEPVALAPADTLGSSDPSSPSTPHTAAGSVLGTLGYMPPEQIEAGAATVDGRADVYALGATLFELLTLEPLHPRHSPLQLIASTLDGADARAGQRAPAADVPPELEAVCVRATASDPVDRHPDVESMIEALEAYLDGDRDLQKRRELAEQHAARAEQLAASAALERRAAAMREAGRALALDPECTPALRVITRLLLEPPPEIPASVGDELLRTDAKTAKAMARFGAYARMGNVVVLALLVWMGVRSWLLFGLVVALTAMSFAAAWRGSREATGRGVPAKVQVGNAVLLGLMATIVGPFMVIPALAVASAAMFVVAGSRDHRRVIAVASLSMVVPFVLERLSLLPVVTTTASGDALTIVPWLVSLPPVPTFALLLLSSIGSITIAVLTMADVRDRLTAARREQLVQAWHLRHLVPPSPTPGVQSAAP